MKFRSRSNRGVASIIGGVFLILIILSAYGFFVISNKATNDLQSTIRTMNAADGDKTQENVVINNVVHSGTQLNINISNQGPKDVNIKYIAWIDMDQPNSIYNFKKVNLVISPGQFIITNVDVNNPSGSYQLKAISLYGNVFTASYPFVSQRSTSISIPPFGKQGTPVTISGSGFTKNSSINIEFDDVSIGTCTTDSSGKFSTIFTVPASSSLGAHNVKATDTNLFFASATFTVT